MRIRKLSDVMAAEVIGLDLSKPLDDAAFADVVAAWHEHLVLVFRDQHLSPLEQAAFARRFGPLQQHPVGKAVYPEVPELQVFTNQPGPDGRPSETADAGRYWHTDLSFEERPALGTMLYGVEVPPEGGETWFANMYAALESLPAETRAAIEGRYATHDYAHRYDLMVRLYGNRRPLTDEQRAKLKPVDHPIVRTHPKTGRKALYVNEGFTRSIVGMPEEESRALLEQLFAHSVRDEFVYRNRWRTNDLVLWDNRCVMHCAQGTDPRYRRTMRRITVIGDRPH